jgi:hypothetical protein
VAICSKIESWQSTFIADPIKFGIAPECFQMISTPETKQRRATLRVQSAIQMKCESIEKLASIPDANS